MYRLFIVGTNTPKHEAAEKTVKIQIAWMSLSAALKVAPSQSGIYFLGAPFNIKYKGGVSRICYIGSSVNLKKRLYSHSNFKTKRGNLFIRTISDHNPEKILCSYYVCPKLKSSRLEGLEEIIIYEFGLRYGYMPFGNSFPPSGDYEEWENKVQINEPFIPGEEIGVDTIMQRYGFKSYIAEYPAMCTIWADFSTGKEIFKEEVWRIVFY